MTSQSLRAGGSSSGAVSLRLATLDLTPRPWTPKDSGLLQDLLLDVQIKRALLNLFTQPVQLALDQRVWGGGLRVWGFWSLGF